MGRGGNSGPPDSCCIGDLVCPLGDVEAYVMSKERPLNGVEPEKSEDDIQRELLGPRGVPGAPDPAKMTPQRAKKTPSHLNPPHVA